MILNRIKELVIVAIAEYRAPAWPRYSRRR